MLEPQVQAGPQGQTEPMSVLLPLTSMVWVVCRSQALYPGANRTHLAQDLEKLKDSEAGGAVAGLTSCITPMGWVSRAVTIHVSKMATAPLPLPRSPTVIPPCPALTRSLQERGLWEMQFSLRKSLWSTSVSLVPTHISLIHTQSPNKDNDKVMLLCHVLQLTCIQPKRY